MSVRSFLFFSLGILLAIVLVFQAGATGQTGYQKASIPKKPFWQKKERIYKKMLEERAIYVSVKTIEGSEPQSKKKMKILGAGVVEKSRDVSWAYLVQFSKWSEIHKSIRVSHWSPSTKRLYLHMEAYKYHAKMIMHVETQRMEQQDWVYMNVVKGSFQGMRVALRLKDAKSRSAEVALSADYDFEKLPMPQFFVEFGLEVVFQKIAEKMRLFVEKNG